MTIKNSYEKNPPSGETGLIVRAVRSGSIGEEFEISPGDRLLSVDGQEVFDELDYLYMTASDEFTLEIMDNEGELWEFEVERSPGEDMGLEFVDTLDAKTCRNHCLFCFIDQMPPGMRDSLYVKDDDERLSFLTGNYITLTNLTERELDRICKWKIPVNISVHTTDDTLRRRMLGNAEAGGILKKLGRLKEAGVGMNAQIVLVPGYNDGDLGKTLRDLSAFQPELASVSVVPVGLTKFRDNLAPIRQFNRSEAREIVKTVENFQRISLKETGSRFCFASDEFYLLSGLPLPDREAYEGFGQIENGVGMIVDFFGELGDALETGLRQADEKRRLVVTGRLVEPVLKEAAGLVVSRYPKARVDILGVDNTFFGESITVAGLLTGKDILRALEELDNLDYDEILLPDTMVRNGTDTFLDDMTVRDLINRLNVPVSVIRADGAAFARSVLGEKDG